MNNIIYDLASQAGAIDENGGPPTTGTVCFTSQEFETFIHTLVAYQNEVTAKYTHLHRNGFMGDEVPLGLIQSHLKKEMGLDPERIPAGLQKPAVTTEPAARVLVYVYGGVASYSADKNVDVFVFDQDNFDAGDSDQKAPAHFKDLADAFSIPVEEGASSKDVASEEGLPGATKENIDSIMMHDVVGDYDVPDEIPEWAWVEREASYSHKRNGQAGIWEFVLNLSRTFEDVPDKLKPVLAKARQDGIAYLIFHQGT